MLLIFLFHLVKGERSPCHLPKHCLTIVLLAGILSISKYCGEDYDVIQFNILVEVESKL